MTAEQERAAVVAWLRSRRPGTAEEFYGCAFANAIERGKHAASPDLLKAREIAADVMTTIGCLPSTIARVLNGTHDTNPEVLAALAGLRAGRAHLPAELDPEDGA